MNQSRWNNRSRLTLRINCFNEYFYFTHNTNYDIVSRFASSLLMSATTLRAPRPLSAASPPIAQRDIVTRFASSLVLHRYALRVLSPVESVCMRGPPCSRSLCLSSLRALPGALWCYALRVSSLRLRRLLPGVTSLRASRPLWSTLRAPRPLSRQA